MTKFASLIKGLNLFKILSVPVKESYKPEKHYMRGPGPKAKAKTGPSSLDGAAKDAMEIKR